MSENSLAQTTSSPTKSALPKPPKAAQKPHTLTTHGHERNDAYYWLREKENPEVVDYLKAENKYTDQIMKLTVEFQKNLFKEMKGRIQEKDLSVPYFDNGFWYYSKYDKGFEYPIYARKKLLLTAPEEILIDVNQIAEGHKFCIAYPVNVSDDNRFLAYALDTVGRNNFHIIIKDLTTGTTLPDQIENTWGNAVFAADNQTIFYVSKDQKTLRADKLMRHKLGSPSSEDVLVHHEKDETFNVSVSRSKSETYIMLHISATLSDEYWFVDAKKPESKFTLFMAREAGHEHNIDHFGDFFYVLTNKNALNFKLIKTPINLRDQANWQEVIAHDPAVFLQSIEIFKHYLVVEQRVKGLNAFRIIQWANNKSYYVDFPEPVFSADLQTNPEFDTEKLRFSYTSLISPNSIFEYDMKTKKRVLLKQQPVLGGYKPEEYVQERHYAPAPDGTMIPVSLVYKKGFVKNGKAPALLYAYGSYGYSMDPSYSSVRLSLLDRGFVYVIAHIRGGQEMGRSWYNDGKFYNKKNTFTDYIAVAQYLIKKKFSSPEKLFGNGGSAGGLLMGAVANMRPDLFKGLIAAVPFVDVVTTMLDATIPLTTGEYDEWGNPNQIGYYIYMLSYSPYDNVERKPYPNMLVTTGLHDSQVQYWEPAKWVARLRERKTDNNLLLLKTDMDAGHGGASGRFKRLHEIAFEYAFMFELLGIKK